MENKKEVSKLVQKYALPLFILFLINMYFVCKYGDFGAILLFIVSYICLGIGVKLDNKTVYSNLLSVVLALVFCFMQVYVLINYTLGGLL